MPELDNDGLWDDDPGAISTYTGRKVNPLTMTASDVSIVDIAASLARQCRYNGHVDSFLSVARHSMWVSEMLPDHLKMAGLLHDAAEAYLGDLVRPLKHGPMGTLYLEAEEHVEQVIAKAFGLPYPIPAEVKEADRRVLMDIEIAGREYRWVHFDYVPSAEQGMFMAAFERLSKPPAMVVGISGRQRSGKSEVGRVFRKFGFVEVHVGNEITAELIEAGFQPTANGGVHMPIPQWLEYHDYEWLKDNTNLREAQIDHGMVRRNENPDYWLMKTMERVKPGGRYVFTSVRFPNEADAIREVGGEVWRINRRGYNPADGADVTETAMDDYPHFARRIHNAGVDLPGLHRSIADLAVQAFPALRQVP